MLSIIVHDNLDGDSLFVGMSASWFQIEDGYLFVEKLTFEEPYQAIKFATRKMSTTFADKNIKDYTGEGPAKPFIMDNDKGWREINF